MFHRILYGSSQRRSKALQPRVGCTRRSVLDLPVPPATAVLSGLTLDPRASATVWLLQMPGDSRLQSCG